MAHRVLAIFRRRLFNSLTILSLLLCLATVALWVRSYWRFDGLRRASGDPAGALFQVQSSFGELGSFVFQSLYPEDRLRRLHYLTSSNSRFATLKTWTGGQTPGRVVSFLGFGYVDDHSAKQDYSLRGVFFPHWFPALLFAILPTIRLRAILRTHRRHRLGLCSHCGYDLRATPDRCPECGHACECLMRNDE